MTQNFNLIKKYQIKKRHIILEKIAFGLLISGVIWFILTLILFLNNQVLEFNKPINSELFAHFGDFVIGTIGPMWTLSSILFFYLTLENQRIELKSQEEKIKIAHIEFQAQIENLKEQNKQFSQERIEMTFFQLLSSHHSIVKTIEVRHTGNEYKYGRECFIPLFKFYKNDYYDKNHNSTIKDKIDISFELFYEKYQEVLGNYFRNLYNIFKFIDNSDTSIYNKKLYTKLLRAQLSNYELLLLFYNCLSTNGEKFKFYAIKYQLFHNLSQSKLIDKTHLEFYESSAF